MGNCVRSAAGGNPLSLRPRDSRRRSSGLPSRKVTVSPVALRFSREGWLASLTQDALLYGNSNIEECTFRFHPEPYPSFWYSPYRKSRSLFHFLEGDEIPVPQCIDRSRTPDIFRLLNQWPAFEWFFVVFLRLLSDRLAYLYKTALVLASYIPRYSP